MAQPLESRITAALRDRARLADVVRVIADVEAAVAATRSRSEAETARSVDPALSTPEAREARNNAADLEHDIRRLHASLDLLTKKRDNILADDAESKRRTRYDRAKAERDELAAHIRDRYPVLAMELAEMAERILRSETECATANLDRPRGEPELVSAEQVARGYVTVRSWNGRDLSIVSRLIDIQLPLLSLPGKMWPAPKGRARDAEAAARKRKHAHEARARAPADREASKGRYLVSCHGGVSFPAAVHVDGMTPVRGAPLDCWMYPEQVEFNRKRGLTVEPWTGGAGIVAQDGGEA